MLFSFMAISLAPTPMDTLFSNSVSTTPTQILKPITLLTILKPVSKGNFEYKFIDTRIDFFHDIKV